MKLEHESDEALKRQILESIGKHIDIGGYRVFLFGSRGSGTPREGSDIDVGIEGAEPISSGALAAIQDEIDALPTLYKIEIVDFSRVTETFKKVAREREYLN